MVVQKKQPNDHRGLVKVQLWIPVDLNEALEGALQVQDYFSRRAHLIRHYIVEGLKRDGRWPTAP